MPMQIMSLLRYAEAFNETKPENYILDSLISRVATDIDIDALIPNRDLTEKFNLHPTFNKYNL